MTTAYAADILPYPEALKKAKEEKKDIIVLTDGSNWLPQSPEVQKAYKQLIDKSTLKDKVVWALNDEPTGQTEEEKKLPRPPLKVWYFPGLQVVDSQGRGIFIMEKAGSEQILQAEKTLKDAIESREKRDEFWSKAEKAKGPKAAEWIAKGLDMLPPSSLKEYKKELERMKKEDPEDNKGYYLRYTFRASSYMDKEINTLIKEKKFEEAYAHADKLLNLPALTTYQKQVITASKFRIAAQAGNQKEGLKYLKQAAALDPKSEFGKGALNLYGYYTRPVALSALSWSDEDNRPDWTPTTVRVGTIVKKPGIYEIDFQHKDGKTRFRKAKFKSGNRILASVDDDKEKSKFEIKLPKAAPSNIVLEVESRGTGWFSGKGNIVITKKS